MGDPDKESEQFVARYIERSPLSLKKLSVHDDIVTYTTKDGAAHEFDALEFLAALSVHIPKTYESITRYYGRYSCRGEVTALSSPLLQLKNRKARTGDYSVRAVGAPASSFATLTGTLYGLCR
jgi:hypothetical protein